MPEVWQHDVFHADGTPYAVLLHEGRVVWKGSGTTMAELSDHLIPAFLAAGGGGASSGV